MKEGAILQEVAPEEREKNFKVGRVGARSGRFRTIKGSVKSGRQQGEKDDRVGHGSGGGGWASVAGKGEN